MLCESQKTYQACIEVTLPRTEHFEPVFEKSIFSLAVVRFVLRDMHTNESRADRRSRENTMNYHSFVVVLLLSFCPLAAAGPFDNLGVPASEIRAWANEVIEFAPTSSGSPDGLQINGLGRPDGEVVSLGDLDEDQLSQATARGSITVSLPYAITDGVGWDFAVFENALLFTEESFVFAELAHVEVSSNGTDFVRFPSTSLNVLPGEGDADTEIITTFGRGFTGINMTNVSNLAGIHPTGLGTAFDLSVLSQSITPSAIDLNAIEFIRIVDIPGDGSVLDSAGRGILDAWPSGGETGGFDLDAVGARHLVAEPSPSVLTWFGLFCLGWLRRR